MSSVKVIDLQNEAVEEAPAPEPIEEAKEEQPEPVVETANEIIEEANEQPKEEVKEKPKRQTQKDKINCGKCGKEMTIKSYRYSHEKNCKGQLSEREVKPHAKPRAKQTPKAKPVVQAVYEEEEIQQPVLNAPVKNQVLKPRSAGEQSDLPTYQQPLNPLDNIQQHYQLLQNEYLKQKQEKYNNLCQNMFTSKPKKR